MEPCAALLALTEREHALVVAGTWEQLAAVDAERRTLLAGLPARAVAGAPREALERAAGLLATTTALLAAQVAELQRSLGHMAQGRVAVRGYGGGTGSAAPARVDLAG
jgi:hypothetical protein